MSTNADDSYDTAFEALRSIYLEDSWVLRLDASQRTVAFTLEAVLTPGHHQYSPPEPGQQHCYRLVTLVLSSDQTIVYDMSGRRPNVDPDGTTDLGNIDTFGQIGPDTWQLTGEWGEITITRPAVDLTLNAVAQ